MSERTIKNINTGKVMTGDLSPSDKGALVDIGQIFINIGRALQQCRTFEEHADTIDKFEEELEKAHEEFDKVDIANVAWE